MPAMEGMFANARAFLALHVRPPGKKLLFMGCEIGQTEEWESRRQPALASASYPVHSKLQTMVKELNWLYRREPALHQVGREYSGFEWIDFHDVDSSIISSSGLHAIARISWSFAAIYAGARHNYRVGVPKSGLYREIFNTDSEMFGGSNVGNGGAVLAEDVACHGRPASLRVSLPPLGVLMFKPDA